MAFIREKITAVDRETLETALREAAKEIGLEIRDENIPTNNKCISTKFYLRGRFFSSMQVTTYDHGRPIDFFRVNTGHPFGRASKKTVERYIERVHNYLKKS